MQNFLETFGLPMYISKTFCKLLHCIYMAIFWGINRESNEALNGCRVLFRAVPIGFQFLARWWHRIYECFWFPVPRRIVTSDWRMILVSNSSQVCVIRLSNQDNIFYSAPPNELKIYFFFLNKREIKFEPKMQH